MPDGAGSWSPTWPRSCRWNQRRSTPFGPPAPDQRGGYFDTELVSDTWRKADIEVTQQFWRRPLSAVLGAFADAGFMMDRVAEALPSAEAVRLFPDDLGPVAGIPTFIVYRLWLQP